MAITYHAGRRIQGTSTDFAGIPAIPGGWKFLDRTTLGQAGNTITVSSLPDKRYYMILTNQYGTGGDTVSQLGLGSNSTIDATGNYARRASNNGGTDSAVNGRSYIFESMGVTQNGMFGVDYIANLSSKEKLGIRHLVYQNTAGAGNIPNREENYGKWANTSNVIDIIQDKNTAAGSFDTGSEIVVLGWDPDDTHTDNFWTQLADVDVTTGTTISTGNFTAKKYLWVQFYLDASAISFDWQFNSSTDTQTSTYSGRHSNNGEGPTATTDYTQINKNVMAENFGLNASPHFGSMFIVNNASKEKLVTGHLVNQNTAGAGYAPNRGEFAYKWTNTTNQINNITMLNSVNVSRFIMKVWGSN
jgi:hypothetical protein